MAVFPPYAETEAEQRSRLADTADECVIDNRGGNGPKLYLTRDGRQSILSLAEAEKLACGIFNAIAQYHEHERQAAG